MLKEKEQQECELLAVLLDHTEPMGSGTLSLILNELALEISPATVGRLLSELDHKGYTKKQGYQGRVLTQAGEERLAELKIKQKLVAYSSQFYKSIDATDKENLIDVLIARRGIEREIVRLAAINATEEDLKHMWDIYNVQAEYAACGKITADHDVDFHHSISKAAGNRVLAAALDFIWQEGKLSPVMEYIRTAVGGAIAVDHKKVLEAISEKNPEKAEKRMVEHIESLIKDVEKYWELAERNK